MLAQSVAAMTTLPLVFVPLPLVASDRSTALRPFPFNRHLSEGRSSQLVWVFFAYEKMLGRTETQTRERMYCESIRTVRDISRDDRARVVTCSLLTQTDIFKENYWYRYWI